MISPVYAHTLFNFLYSNVDGYTLSSKARKKFIGTTEDLLYGEIPFKTWKQIVEYLDTVS